MAKVDTGLFGMPAIRFGKGRHMNYVGPSGPSSQRACRLRNGRIFARLEMAARLSGAVRLDRQDVAYAAAVTVKPHQVKQARRDAWRDRPRPSAGVPTMGAPELVAPSTGRMEAAGRSCVYCGEPATDIDHVWPRSRGGDDHPNNLVPACQSCNTRKGGKSLFVDRCQVCSEDRHPGDMDTARGIAFYHCRCGQTWDRTWDLQAARFR